VGVSAFRILKLVWALKPHLILSGMVHLNFMVLLLRPFFPAQTRLLARQNGTASTAIAFGNLPSYTPLLYRLLYRQADRVICQTTAMASDLAERFGIPPQLLAVLPNPVDLEAIRERAMRTQELQPNSTPNYAGPHLVAIGRLSREKGFDLLLEALSVVRERFPHADLIVAGAGPEEQALKARRRELSFQSTANFCGNLAQPAVLFPTASLFVLPSRHEGLPNALLEAAGAGLPIVALPASEGLVELLRGQPGVWLAPEISSPALAATLLTALDALRPGERFAHAFIERYALGHAIHAYEALIDSVLEGRGR
jgi:glycosyltransferase involved in cell wall biosynthesis